MEEKQLSILSILEKTEFLETGKTRIDDFYEKEDAGYLQKLVYSPRFTVIWNYSELNSETEWFNNFKEAVEDLNRPGDITYVSDSFETYKELRVHLQEIWLDGNNDVVEEGEIIPYCDYYNSEDPKPNLNFISIIGTPYSSILTKFFNSPEHSAENLEMDVYWGINKAIEGERNVFGVECRLKVNKSEKYRDIEVSDKKDNHITKIRLRIADHTYNPSRASEDENFISIEIHNRPKGRYKEGLKALSFNGEDSFENVVDAVNERINDIIEGCLNKYNND